MIAADMTGELRIEATLDCLEQAGRLQDVVGLWQQWQEELGHEDANAEGFAVDMLTGIRNQSVCFLVAYNGYGQAVGMMSLFLSHDTTYTGLRMFGERLYVLPEYRQQGVLKAMAQRAEDVALFLGVTEGMLAAPWDNEWLRDFYHGWEFAESEVIMVRRMI